MGSEGPPAVTVHVTGFKKFHGVAENPTETIISNLKEYMNKKGLPKGVVLGSCTVLDTAGQGALSPLYQTLQSAVNGKEHEPSNSARTVWVSLHIYYTILSSSYCLGLHHEYFLHRIVNLLMTISYSRNRLSYLVYACYTRRWCVVSVLTAAHHSPILHQKKQFKMSGVGKEKSHQKDIMKWN